MSYPTLPSQPNQPPTHPLLPHSPPSNTPPDQEISEREQDEAQVLLGDLPHPNTMSAPMARQRPPAVNDPRRGITKFTVYIPDSITPSHPSHPSNSSTTTNSLNNRGAPSQAQSIGEGKGKGKGSSTSRWSSWEFRFYGLAFLGVVPWMVWIPVRLSSSLSPNWWMYANKLSEGWLFGRKIDISDPQYRSFRQNLFPLLLLSNAHFLFSRIFSNFSAPTRSPPTSTSTPSLSPYALWNSSEFSLIPDRVRLRTRLQKTQFLAAFNLVLISVLHGTSALKILIILLGNYVICRWAAADVQGKKRKRLGWLAVWGWNVGVLFANDWWAGYRFGAVWEGLRWLDEYSGLLPRWHINFNMTMLRLISFGMDWSAATAAVAVNEGNTVTSGNGEVSSSTKSASPPTTYKERVKTSLPLEEYNFTNLLAYALYPPLYIAGPIMTFNDFIWQTRNPVPLPPRSIASYAFRFLSCLLTMEFVLHFMYVVAIKDTGAWEGSSPAELSMIGFWNLIVVWLKLLIPWRFFRLWALLDGMDPPENMIRCMANNYSISGFWRSWHRSYNLWVVRYIYIPLGGAKNPILATLVVFTFVALWHDLSFRLLTWGWLISLFILPELVAQRVVPASKYGQKPWYRPVAGIGAVASILMMMVANLVGFVVGVDGIQYMGRELVSSWQGLNFLLFSCVCLYIAAQVMFEYRETEHRQGISRRC